MLRLYYDERNVVRLASTTPVITNLYKCIETTKHIPNPVGKKIVFQDQGASGGIRLAVICNWDSECGIATYAKYLVDSLAPKVDALKIFSEKTNREKLDTPYNVTYCWRRGEPMRSAVEDVLEWQPTIVLIQHEYGIFPKTSYMLQMLQLLENTPYVVTMHSVYEHLDKTVVSSAMKNLVVHTTTGQACLRRLGNRSRTWVIPHGCVVLDDTTELWNTWQTDYPIVQFGFGFGYKGVDTALEALSLLKKRHGKKYQRVFYTYFCSENEYIKNIIDEYVSKLTGIVKNLGLDDNVAIVRGYQTEQTINNCLRTSRLALFPYKTDPKNVVYGASGAVRIAMANGVPVIASCSHMFDDLDGVLPRPKNAEQLAEAIDHTFSNESYRKTLLDRSARYVRDNSWNTTADRYLSVFQEVTEGGNEGVIYL